MKIKDLSKFNLPDSPGVYFFKKDKEILYIGKATSLKDRVKSYFSSDLIKTRGSRIIDMVTISNNLEFQKTDSVLEALILESNLIKKHKPYYNIKEKDNKSYYSVVITNEKFPRVLLVRDKDLKNRTGDLEDLKIKKTFGPFPNSSQIKEALKILKKIFPFVDSKKSIEKMSEIDKKRLILNIQIGLYPDIFSGKVALKEYLETIRNIILFFQAKKSEIIKRLKKEMKTFSEEKEFEKANQIKKTLFALDHIRDVSLIKTDFESEIFSERMEAFDVAHFGGKSTVGVMVVIQNSFFKKEEYKKFNIKQAKKFDDYGALTEILKRRFNHPEWKFPDLIVIDGGKQHFNLATKTLDDLKIKIPIVSVVKDDKHKPKDILGDFELIKKHKESILKINAEAHRFAIQFMHTKNRKLP